MDRMEKIGAWMLNQTEHGNWNGTEHGFHYMMETIEKAKTDCSDHPTLPSPEECHHAEFRMEETLDTLIQNVLTQNRDETIHHTYELEHEVFWLERACQLKDKCKEDWDRIGHITHFMADETERGNWHMVDTIMSELIEFLQEDVSRACDHHRGF